MSTVLVALYFVLQCVLSQISITEAEDVSSVSFDLHDVNDFQTDGDAVFMGGNIFTITESTKGLGDGSAGRVVYSTPITLWNASTKSFANFSTQFQFQINWTRKNDTDLGGDGLAFFMASQRSGFQVSYRGDGGWLGLFNPQNNGKSSNMIVAIEFDTWKYRADIDDNHMGIDVNSIDSQVSVPLAQRLTNGKIWEAKIDYRGQENLLTVSAGSEGKIAGNLSYNINLTRYLPPDIVVGFSAAARKSSESHRLISWKFTSVISGSSLIQSTGKKEVSWKVGITVCSAISVAGIFVSFVICRYSRRNREAIKDMEQQSDMDIALEHVPRKFIYSELCSSTSNFSEEKRLGRGGFGDVYKGILVQSVEIVAVKRISAGSKQGKREYLAEISTITRLRHRNLVQLLGWCHEKGQLLLVYEYMPNGSLDNLLFGTRIGELQWNPRYRIAIDIASALLYLHESWDECVMHRDIKSSNVLLDSEFNAKLGDFGLARLVKHDQRFQTSKLAGTLGYLAPECAARGIFSTESDVFSFGAVALEIACGRPALDQTLEGPETRLVEWVWELYGGGRLLDAADSNLVGVFERAEMEQLMMIGLWCSHPDSFTRPKIRQVLQLLNFEAPMPRLPSTLPKPTHSPAENEFNSHSSNFAVPPDSGSTDIAR